jgi:hypothetical protein
MPPVSNEQPPGEPARDDDPTRPGPRPVAPPGQVSTPDQLPTVEPGEWPAQPPDAIGADTIDTPSDADGPAPPPPPLLPHSALAAPPPPVPVPPPLAADQAAAPYSAPAPAERSLAWLWGTLAVLVVLVVGAVTALAVVSPWEDSGERDDSAVPGQTEDPADAEPPDSEPSLPPTISPPTSPPTSPPPPATPVTADLDGDGLGDAAAVFGSGDRIERLVLSSTGRSFTVTREAATVYDDRTWADFDGDGSLDQISWAFELGGTLTLTSEDMDFRELNLGLPLDERQPYVTLKSGDFDGDGAIDLVAYGATSPREVSVWVIRNNGEGFDEPAEWLRLPNTTYLLTTVLAADFTGDGLTDVVARVPKDGVPRKQGGRSDLRFGIALLKSNARAFVAGPIQRPSTFIDVSEAIVGDFVGDGTPLLMLLGPGRNGVKVQVLRVAGSLLLRDPRWERNVGGAGSNVVDAVVTDVDGDGTDDVVYTSSVVGGRGYDGFRVLRSTGTSVKPSAAWAATPRCPARGCALYFQNGY